MRFIAAFVVLVTACGDDDASGRTDATAAPDAALFDGGSSAQPKGIYVTNQANRITVFALDAVGDVAPMRTIEGEQTGLNLPIGIAMDTEGNLYAANRSGGTITVYPGDATGDVAPIRTLTGVGLGSPEGLAIAPTDELFATSCPGCGGPGGETGVFHFPDEAIESDAVLGGATNANTGFTNPVAVAVDPVRDELYVGSAFGGSVQVFALGATGDVAPARAFFPGAGNLQWLTYASDTVFVSMPGVGIQQFASTATGTPTPAAVLPFGDPLAIAFPATVFVDTAVLPPDLYIADYSGAAVFIVHTTGTPPNLAIASVEVIRGAATLLSNPLGIYVVK